MDLDATAPQRPTAPPRPATPANTPPPALSPDVERLLSGVRAFQHHTAPLVRTELARLAREGQTPSHLFITCADSRMVTSLITNSGPGDLFTVRNVGNLVPPPHGAAPVGNRGDSGADTHTAADDSVGAAVQYAVEVLNVRGITVCGHSGCGAMQALLSGDQEPDSGEPTPLGRWLSNGRASLDRLRREPARFADRAADEMELLCLTNVVQQLQNLAAHPALHSRMADGTLHLVGMYFDLATAQTHLLDEATGAFSPVRPDHPVRPVAPRLPHTP